MSVQRGSTTSAFDLTSIPEPMRSLVARQLDKMPAPLREKLLREGSPILDRLVARAREHAASGTAPLPPSAAQTYPDDDDAAPPAPVSTPISSAARDRVPTVMPGDTGSAHGWLLASAIAVVGAAWYAMQG